MYRIVGYVKSLMITISWYGTLYTRYIILQIWIIYTTKDIQHQHEFYITYNLLIKQLLLFY